MDIDRVFTIVRFRVEYLYLFSFDFRFVVEESEVERVVSLFRVLVVVGGVGM